MKELVQIQSKLKAPKGQYNKGKIDNELKGYILLNFKYNSDTGIITRTDRKNSLGSYDSDGYLILKIKGKQFKAHRIAWLLFYGEIPTMEIDHINRLRTDNRISNLRLADRYLNCNNQNRQINKDTGVIGIYIDKCTKSLNKKYTTRIAKKTYRFYTLEDAIKFRIENGKRVYK